MVTIIDGDMKERAHILVSEVFDSELIGEGAIGTFSDAAKELLVVRIIMHLYVHVCVIVSHRIKQTLCTT